MRPAGPHVSDETLLQSVATALHVCAMPVTGQPPMRSHYDKEIVYRIPDQPLVQVWYYIKITTSLFMFLHRLI